MDVTRMQPLIHYLEASGYRFRRGDTSGGTTYFFTENHLHEAFWRLHRGRPDDVREADACVRRAIDKVGKSERVGLLVLSADGNSKKVMVFSEELDRRLKERIECYIVWKQYAPEKVARLAPLYADLYYERLRNAEFPHTEVTACSASYVLARRAGLNLAMQYCPAHPERHDALISAALDGCENYSLYFDEHYRSLQLPVFPYEEAFKRSALTMRHVLRPEGQELLDTCLDEDARKIASHLAADRQVPYVDPTCLNLTVEPDGTVSFNDLERWFDYTASIRDMEAHVRLDPAYRMMPQERMAAMGAEGLHAAFNYSTRRVGRMLARSSKPPIGAWWPLTEERFVAFLENLQHVSTLAAGRYGTARAFLSIDHDAAMRRFLRVQDEPSSASEVDDHGDA